MSKKITSKRSGYLLIFVSVVSVILVILLTSFLYFLEGGMKVYKLAINDSTAVLSAYNLMYYDMATGRYASSSSPGYNNMYYASQWTQTGNNYTVTYKIPIELSDTVTPGDCSAHNLVGEDNCISNNPGNFTRWQKIKVELQWDSTNERYIVTLTNEGYA